MLHVTHGGPQVALDRLPVTGQFVDRGLIHGDHARLPDTLPHQVDQRCHAVSQTTHPTPLRAAVNTEAAPTQDVFQAIVRQVIGETTDGQVRPQARTGERLDQRSRPPGRDHRGRLVGPIEGEDLLPLLDHLQLHRGHLERFADLLEEPANVRVVPHLRRDVFRLQMMSLLFPWQKLGEGPRLTSLAGPLPFLWLLVLFIRLRLLRRGCIKQQRLCRILGKTFPSATKQAALQQRVVGGQVLDRLLLVSDRLLVLGHQGFEMGDVFRGVLCFGRRLQLRLELLDQGVAALDVSG